MGMWNDQETPVFGILYKGCKVLVQIVSDVEAKTLLPFIINCVKFGSTVYSDTWKSYMGVAIKGNFHCLIEHQKGEYVNEKGNHVNCLEGFGDTSSEALTRRVE